MKFEFLKIMAKSIPTLHAKRKQETRASDKLENSFVKTR